MTLHRSVILGLFAILFAGSPSSNAQDAANLETAFLDSETHSTPQQMVRKPISETGSGFFHASKEYNSNVRKAIVDGDFKKVVESGMKVQNAIDVAAYDQAETARLVGQSAAKVVIADEKKELSETTVLKQILFLQQIQIAQNKVLIRLLTEVAHPKRAEPAK